MTEAFAKAEHYARLLGANAIIGLRCVRKEVGSFVIVSLYASGAHHGVDRNHKDRTSRLPGAPHPRIAYFSLHGERPLLFLNFRPCQLRLCLPDIRDAILEGRKGHAHGYTCNMKERPLNCNCDARPAPLPVLLRPCPLSLSWRPLCMPH
jgi:hypothetical protein